MISSAQCNIACVLKSGGIYDPTWVERLRAGVAQNLPVTHRFVCLSDVEVPCERIALTQGWPGWWSKIELFRAGLFKGRVLFLDLDVLVTGDLWPLLNGSGFRICKDWWLAGFNSSVMAWDAGDTEIFERFNPEIMSRLHGDQDWIGECRPDAQIFDPELVVSYKAHCQRGLPHNARVVCCHGRPKPNKIMDEWFRSRWLSHGAGVSVAV